jgi:hypothetical protein
MYLAWIVLKQKNRISYNIVVYKTYKKQLDLES